MIGFLNVEEKENEIGNKEKQLKMFFNAIIKANCKHKTMQYCIFEKTDDGFIIENRICGSCGESLRISLYKPRKPRRLEQ